ncbi:MAG: glutamate-5-semialdehyde dehydrogenase [Actinomycetota bacterium]|nr:glutamate-5-semialdehyde dehydrogenase [Actinomycetota bacterium]
MNPLIEVGRRARIAAEELAQSSTVTKKAALLAMSKALLDNQAMLIDANRKEVDRARDAGVSSALLDRLTLTPSRLKGMCEGLEKVAEQPDPIGQVVEEWTRPNGLRIQKVRVPMGVVAVIYEARPNVTADVAGLCLMSGNAVILRGSSQALETNKAAVRVLARAAEEAGIPPNAIQLVEDTSRESATHLMQLEGYVDLLIPRGGQALISSIYEKATVPYIIDGDGNCHVYVDAAADPKMARSIVINAKTQRPSVCNAAETLLVHREIAGSWLPGVLDELAERGVEVRGDPNVLDLWPEAVEATEEDWRTEYLDLILAVRVVDSLDEAIDHVNTWGTSNAEAIVTEDAGAADVFARRVDSGSIFINASTRFSDGGEFGYGAEIGISTQKLHARGPMGLKELTTCKYLVWGDGHTRQ